jgi:hypothetical protein
LGEIGSIRFFAIGSADQAAIVEIENQVRNFLQGAAVPGDKNSQAPAELCHGSRDASVIVAVERSG